MTGFGIAQAELEGVQVAVEVRSVNNRHLKTTLRVSDSFMSLEPEVDAIVSKRLVRGSVMVSLRVSNAASRIRSRIDGDRLKDYIGQIESTLGHEAAAKIDTGELLTLPGVVVEDGGETFLEQLRPVVSRLAKEACEKVMTMRAQEGDALRLQLVGFARTIRERLGAVGQRVPSVVAQYQVRLRQRIDALLKEIGMTSKPEDVLREVAVFAERADIAEELARLEGHLEQFESLIDPAEPAAVGRTLDFVAQEMLREANTIASKSGDVEISRLVVEMKTAIDRIKEQVQNAE